MPCICPARHVAWRSEHSRNPRIDAEEDAGKLAEPFPDAAKLAARRKDAQTRPLFQMAEPLAVTLSPTSKR